MGFLSRMLDSAKKTVASYTGDAEFLLAAASAAANVVAADGTIEDAEVDAAIAGMMGNKILASSYAASKIEEEVGNAIQRAKTRAGRIQNQRHIEHMLTRDVELRQDILLIAADTTEGNSLHHLGEDEKKALEAIAKCLNLDANKLLAA